MAGLEGEAALVGGEEAAMAGKGKDSLSDSDLNSGGDEYKYVRDLGSIHWLHKHPGRGFIVPNPHLCGLRNASVQL